MCWSGWRVAQRGRGRLQSPAHGDKSSTARRSFFMMDSRQRWNAWISPSIAPSQLPSGRVRRRLWKSTHLCRKSPRAGLSSADPQASETAQDDRISSLNGEVGPPRLNNRLELLTVLSSSSSKYSYIHYFQSP